MSGQVLVSPAARRTDDGYVERLRYRLARRVERGDPHLGRVVRLGHDGRVDEATGSRDAQIARGLDSCEGDASRRESRTPVQLAASETSQAAADSAARCEHLAAATHAGPMANRSADESWIQLHGIDAVVQKLPATNASSGQLHRRIRRPRKRDHQCDVADDVASDVPEKTPAHLKIPISLTYNDNTLNRLGIRRAPALGPYE